MESPVLKLAALQQRTENNAGNKELLFTSAACPNFCTDGGAEKDHELVLQAGCPN